MTQLRGLVIKAQSGFFSIETDEGIVISRIPKKLRYRRRKKQETEDVAVSSIVAVGDYVTVRVVEEDEGQLIGVIEAVDPRKSVLSRARPAAMARQVLTDKEQVLVANPDQVIYVFAVKDPEPSLRKLDRLLVITEMNELPAIICANKVDLVTQEAAEALFQPYADLGYRVIYTSSTRGDGVEELRELLTGRISVFSGSSGVGKSSLMNAVQDGLGIEVGAVSEATTKGMHTTRYTALYKLDGGGYVADTPGIRGVAVFDVEPEELDAYFREIAPLVADCRFSDCRHEDEPGCAVRTAVENGAVSAERYDSYLRLREEHEELQRRAYG